MKHISISLLAMAALSLSVASCSKTQNLTASYAYANQETTCMGISHTGSQTLRSWGSGPTKGDAIEQARKNAIYDVIFKGIKGGDCNSAPLVSEVNAAERYSTYFDRFFAKGGEYLQYSKVEMGAPKPLIEAKGTGQIAYGVVVSVDRAALRSLLIKDGVLSETNVY